MNAYPPSRVIIERVSPQITGNGFLIKKAVDEVVDVCADIFADGHDQLSANLLWKKESATEWNTTPMHLVENDRWKGRFVPKEIGMYLFTVEAWVNPFETWRKDFEKKHAAGQELSCEFLIGSMLLEEIFPYVNEPELEMLKSWQQKLLTEKDLATVQDHALTEMMRTYTRQINPARYPKELRVICTRKKALFSTWYEVFPRSLGTFQDCISKLPEIARMGFDVLYFPPIHPIGHSNRKGKNNALQCTPNCPGSPWAIGSKEGGHDAIHPELGTLAELHQLVQEAKRLDIEIALDLAFQCSPDHPYIKEHPEWFKWRPDGTIQHAENPPKKYEDIVPFNFETDDWKSLWNELKRVVFYWIAQGITIFRVDNPHTKPFAFWEWLIAEVKAQHPEVLFLSEAFTRPKVMQYLAKIGFDQSYTYFTWRNTKHDLMEYIKEMLHTEMRDFFRPNLWPNTPDILPEVLQHGGKPAFMVRLALAATLSSNYGIYSPPFELCINEAIEGTEEYLNAEKYELRQWNWNQKGNIADFIALVNKIRKENTPLHSTWNLEFCEIDNDYLLGYTKVSDDGSPPLLMIVNMDFFHTQSGWIQIPLETLGLKEGQQFLAHDLVSDDKYMWQGKSAYIELDPRTVPVHILRIHGESHREQGFDYYI